MFGASDKPLPGKDLDEAGLAQFPMVMGGIVPVVNLEGIKPGELVIDGPTLANIFLGTIKTWDDPAIKKLNPDKLPSTAIAVVHRSDGSGTTYNFTDYLAAVSADWKSKVGVDTSVEWPVGIGAKGNEGVANNVAQTAGSIGYVEYRLRQAEQADPHQDDEQGRQAGEADARLCGGRRERRLEQRSWLWIICQSAGRRVLADDRCDLDPDVQGPGRCGCLQGGPQVLCLGLRERRQDG